ncbi:hypothetical protein C0Z17_02055 [Trinickia caryophylli]|nr:hypothetical protein C0Z17_02055 [Trinickia caryophylli]
MGRSPSASSSVAAHTSSRRWEVRIDDTHQQVEYEPSEASSSLSRDEDSLRVGYSDIRRQSAINRSAEKMYANLGDELPDLVRSQVLSGRGPYLPRDNKNPETGRAVLAVYESMVEEGHRKLGPEDWRRRERLWEIAEEARQAAPAAHMAGLDISEDSFEED